MKKKNLCLIILLTCIIILSGCSKEGTDGNDDHPSFQEIWFPMEVGYQWEYAYKGLGDTTIHTIVGDTIIDGTEYNIMRYDYQPPEHEPHARFWHVDFTQAFWLNGDDTVLVFNFPFIEEEWNVIGIDPKTNTFGDTVGLIHSGWETNYPYSVFVPLGNFYNCWRMRWFWIESDTVDGIMDTTLQPEGHSDFLGRNTGIIIMYDDELLSFETGVDVDSLYILPPQQKSRGQFDLYGRYKR